MSENLTKKDWIDIVNKKIDQAIAESRKSGVNLWIIATTMIVLANYFLTIIITGWSKLILREILVGGLLMFYIFLFASLLLSSTSGRNYATIRLRKRSDYPEIGVIFIFTSLLFGVPLGIHIYFFNVDFHYGFSDYLSIVVLSLMILLVVLGLFYRWLLDFPEFIYEHHARIKYYLKGIAYVVCFVLVAHYAVSFSNLRSKNLEISVLNLKIALLYWMLIYLSGKFVEVRSKDFFIADLTNFVDAVTVGAIKDSNISRKYRELIQYLTLRDWLGQRAEQYKSMTEEARKELDKMWEINKYTRSVIEDSIEKGELPAGSVIMKLRKDTRRQKQIFKQDQSRQAKLHKHLKRTILCLKPHFHIIDKEILEEFAKDVERSNKSYTDEAVKLAEYSKQTEVLGGGIKSIRH